MAPPGLAREAGVLTVVPAWSSFSAIQRVMGTSLDHEVEMEYSWEFFAWVMEVLAANELVIQRSVNKVRKNNHDQLNIKI